MNFNFLGDFFGKAKDWLTDAINTIQSAIMILLPDSPFKGLEIPSEIQEILGYINWLVPFYMIGNVLLAWTGAIVVYYAYQIILRWIKSIQ
ncbi:MAG: hypothetical protein J6O50_08070 [Ruminiclostridium sp.]|nr:hypothetical protein [Ruminiclostridium sp.]